MPRTTSSTRARLMKAALELFSTQGVTETTTRQIAELAQVNEVTLFRQFGSKQGLLLAVIEDSGVFTRLGELLRLQVHRSPNVQQALKHYGRDRLQALEQIPELLRSVVGEAGKYTVENREALGKGIAQANRDVAEYLATLLQQEGVVMRLPAEKLASLLNGMLFGYLVIELTSEFQEVWQDGDDFLDSLVELFLNGAVSRFPDASTVSNTITIPALKVADLSADVVYSILRQAKKSGWRDYALAYVLFSTGLFPHEIVILDRQHQITNPRQHLLQIPQGRVRQVPVNQYIMGKRYGSYIHNPLNQWLKSRKDRQSALFLTDQGQRLSVSELVTRWQAWTVGLSTPDGQPILIEQARQTWCVEMLMRGITVEDLSILSGWDRVQLEPYLQRAKEKAALDKALRLDQKA